jgi:hypothetical protein
VTLPCVHVLTRCYWAQGPGGHFYPHFDSNPLFQLGAQHLPPGVPNHGRGFGFPYAARYVTLLIFLNTPAEGGNTTFPLVGPNPMHTAKASPSSALGLRDVMGRFGNVNPDALRLWQSHDEHCDGADGCLSIAPKAGDAVLFYNHHVVRPPLVHFSLLRKCAALYHLHLCMSFHHGDRCSTQLYAR